MRNELRGLALAAMLISIDGCVATPPTVTPVPTGVILSSQSVVLQSPTESISFGPPAPEVTRQENQTSYTKENVAKRVQELARCEEDWCRVYQGTRPNNFDKTIVLPAQVDLILDSDDIAQYGFSVTIENNSKDNRIAFQSHSEAISSGSFPTIDRVNSSIFLSRQWLSMQSPEVQKLVLKKEANNILMMPGFGSLFALPLFEQEGTFTLLDPTVTRDEIAIKIGLSYANSSPMMQRLFDFAGYLSIMKEYDELEKRTDPGVINDLKTIPAIKNLRDFARQYRVPYQDLEFNSPAFFQIAFGSGSTWVSIIENISYTQN